MNKFLIACLGCALGGNALDVAGQDKPPAAEAETLQQELDAFRDGLFHAFNEGRYEEMLQEFCHPDVIVVWQDGTAGKGHADVLAEFDKLSKFIAKMQVQPTTERRLILDNGRLVISSGYMHDQYALERGADVELNSSWSATLVKENDTWTLVSFSASANAFDNEVVDMYLQLTKYWSAGIASAVGIVLGIIIALAIKRRS